MIYYVARDKDGSLYMYYNYPFRDVVGIWIDNKSINSPLELNKHEFLEVTWESEPLRVEIKKVLQ